MKRTLLSLGNSTAVTLPASHLEALGLKAGDAVEVVPTAEGFLIRPQAALEADFEQALRKVVGRHRAVLSKLAAHDRGEG
ncbi:MAG: hypothetical protein C4332_15095 [Meiothermus sp.]